MRWPLARRRTVDALEKQLAEEASAHETAREMLMRLQSEVYALRELGELQRTLIASHLRQFGERFEQYSEIHLEPLGVVTNEPDHRGRRTLMARLAVSMSLTPDTLAQSQDAVGDYLTKTAARSLAHKLALGGWPELRNRFAEHLQALKDAEGAE